MAVRDFIKKQFIDVIHWTEDADGVLAWRFPMQDFEIQYGAQLTVRESQMAVFINEGKVADVFGPGRYKLTTRTLPVLTNLLNWDKKFESPFKSEVYFFSSRLQLNQTWGTPNPVTVRDKEFGAVRIRAFGVFAYRIANPADFHARVSGTLPVYTTEDAAGQLRSTIISRISDAFGEAGEAFLDLAGNQDELAARVRESASQEFAALGLALDNVQVQNISLPEELQQALDKRISMGMIGDLSRYTQYQVAESVPVAAANEGGLAGIGAGLGAGFTFGQVMSGSVADALAGNSSRDAAPAPGDVMSLIEKLHDMQQKGILTAEEFSAKKAELLKRIG